MVKISKLPNAVAAVRNLRLRDRHLLARGVRISSEIEPVFRDLRDLISRSFRFRRHGDATEPPRDR